jgi:hypothetical protein
MFSRPQTQTWPAANAGSIQSKSWLAMGFNFQKHIESVLGDKLQRPLQKFHGSQIENLFNEQDVIWQRDPLKSAIEALQDDNAVGVYIRDLLKGWKAV